MARITIDDCLDNVNSKFELVITASQRAHRLMLETNQQQSINGKKDKATVTALREIANDKSKLKK
jgi:DNA-directed RNA polymerase subunit omega